MKNNEKEILIIIKYLPVVLILLISSLLTYFLYNQNINHFNEENQKLEEKYISLNKDLTKFQIDKIKSNILYEKKEQIRKLKKELNNQVNNAHNIANSIYQNNKDKLSKEEIISLIKDALREIRFNENRGYFFIYDINSGLNILHPIKQHLENKNLWEYQDTKGTYLLQEMNKILKNKNSTYFNWFWTKPNESNKEYEKIGYFRKFEPYEFFIGTGEYIIDFEEELKNRITKTISDFRYKKDAYVFILDFDGNYLSYYNKEFIGKNLFDFDIVSDKKNILTKLKERSKNGGYLSYDHKDKPFNKSSIKKITYVDRINDWNWIIGTGFYMDDFYKELDSKKKYLQKNNKEALEKLFIGSIIVTLLFLFIFIYLSKLLEKKFYAYKLSIEKQMKDNIKKDNILAHQSKLAAMGEMLGNIAHQWRQPLSAIATIVSGIRMHRELGNKNEDLENESFLKIKNHIEYLSNTIDDFSNFFKPNKLAKEFELEVMINKTLELVDNQLKMEEINIIKDIKNQKIFGFENELIQVLINLINNARDELSKINDEKFIFISNEINEKNIIIKIKDNAGGIDSSIIDRIFEPYFSTKGSSKGTGIGLFMSEEILVKHLEGDINVENISFDIDGKTYKGAQFDIVFPIIHVKTKESLS